MAFFIAVISDLDKTQFCPILSVFFTFYTGTVLNLYISIYMGELKELMGQAITHSTQSVDKRCLNIFWI
jgi:hypothetical protein